MHIAKLVSYVCQMLWGLRQTWVWNVDGVEKGLGETEGRASFVVNNGAILFSTYIFYV